MAVLAVDLGGTNLRTAIFGTPEEMLHYHHIPCKDLGNPVPLKAFTDHLMLGEHMAGLTGQVGTAAIHVHVKMSIGVGNGCQGKIAPFDTVAPARFGMAGQAVAPGGTLDILGSWDGGLDQTWEDGIARISGEAKFAGYSQAFGFTDSGGYNELFEVPEDDYGFFTPGAHQFTVDLTGEQWTWDRSDATGDGSHLGSLFRADNRKQPSVSGYSLFQNLIIIQNQIYTMRRQTGFQTRGNQGGQFSSHGS